jgi:hypothetical protein
MNDDIFCNNNSNILVVDDETLATSIAAQKFVVRCHWLEASLPGFASDADWRSRLVAWDELTCDPALQRCFFYDHSGAQRALVDAQCRAFAEQERAAADAALEAERDRKASSDKRLRTRAIELLTEHDWLAPEPEQTFWEAWRETLRELWRRDIKFDPDYPDNLRDLQTVVKALASAKAGGPVGYAPTFRLVQIAHSLADKAPDAVPLFERVLNTYGYGAELADQDKTGKWRAKRARLPHRPLPAYLYRAAAFILELPEEILTPPSK